MPEAGATARPTPDERLPYATLDHAGLDATERQRRANELEGVRRRIAHDGWRVALHSPDRARQFMPFAALKGYDEMVRSVAERKG